MQSKIKEKHPDVALFTEYEKFQLLMDNTICSIPYKKCDLTINYVAYIEEDFILYSLKKEKHHTSCNTIYSLNKKTLKQYYKQDNFKILKQEYKNLIEEYIAD